MRIPSFLVSLAIALGFVAGAFLLFGAFMAPLVRSFGFGGPQGTPYCVAGVLLLLASTAALVGRFRSRRGPTGSVSPRTSAAIRSEATRG